MTDRRAAIGPFADRLDRIARTAYGTEHGGTVEALLEANPAIVRFPVSIEPGTTIEIPEQVAEDVAATTRPWI